MYFSFLLPNDNSTYFFGSVSPNLKPPVSNEGRLFLAANKLFSATLLMHFGARKSSKYKFRCKNQKLQKLGENSRNREEMENRSRKKIRKVGLQAQMIAMHKRALHSEDKLCKTVPVGKKHYCRNLRKTVAEKN